MRGPKPSAAIREIGLVPDVQVPEPNTWRELLTVMRDRPETRLALQEYGKLNQDLIDGLTRLFSFKLKCINVSHDIESGASQFLEK